MGAGCRIAFERSACSPSPRTRGEVRAVPCAMALPHAARSLYINPMAHPEIFDRTLLRRRQARAAVLGPADFLLERAAGDLAERLSAVLRPFELGVDLGTPGDAVRHALAGRVPTLVSASPRVGLGPLRVVADEEALPFRDGS